jgi:hypothetical protein
VKKETKKEGTNSETSATGRPIRKSRLKPQLTEEEKMEILAGGDSESDEDVNDEDVDDDDDDDDDSDDDDYDTHNKVIEGKNKKRKVVH